MPKDYAEGEAGKEVVAQRAVGLDLQLAAALDEARVEDRPELERAGAGAGQLDRAVLRLGRERDDEVEADLQVLKSMVGFILAGVACLAVRTFA